MMTALQPKLQEPLSSRNVKIRTYNSLVLQTLECSASVWDPHISAIINRLEQVQRRGSIDSLSNYREKKTPGCVNRIVHDLGWQTLEERRRRLRLTMLFKFQHGLTDVVPGHILRPNNRRTRGGHRLYQPATTLISTSSLSSHAPYATGMRYRQRSPTLAT